MCKHDQKLKLIDSQVNVLFMRSGSRVFLVYDNWEPGSTHYKIAGPISTSIDTTNAAVNESMEIAEMARVD